MAAASNYAVQNFEFSGLISRPGTTKGSIHASDGTNMNLVAPSADGQVLTADSTQASGVIWKSAITSLGYGITSPQVAIPATSTSVYFLNASSTATLTTTTVPNSYCILATVNTNINGYATTPANITGGNLDFTLGFVNSNTQTIIANFNAYAGSPHFQVSGASINTAGTNFSTFTFTLNITIAAGEQICMRMTNNLTTSAAPGFNDFNCVMYFRTR